MKIDILEILESYAAKIKPKESRKQLAEARLAICSECDKLKGEKFVEYCGECGCFISGKIFTPKEGQCPLKKWDDIDREYFNAHATKIVKSGRKLV